MLLQGIVIRRRHITSVADNGFTSLYSWDETWKPRRQGYCRKKFSCFCWTDLLLYPEKRFVCRRSVGDCSNSNTFICVPLSVCMPQTQVREEPNSAISILSLTRIRNQLRVIFVTDSTSYTMGTGSSFPGLKRPGREADHSPSTSAEVKKMWIYTSTPPYAFMA
jgi:hypothetical protein